MLLRNVAPVHRRHQRCILSYTPQGLGFRFYGPHHPPLDSGGFGSMWTMTVGKGLDRIWDNHRTTHFGIWQQASSGQVVFFFLVGGFKSF